MENIINTIETIRTSYNQIRMNFIVRTSRQSDNNEYLAYDVPISSKITSDIVDLVLLNVEKTLEDKELLQFNPTNTEINTIEYLPLLEVNNYENISDAINSINRAHVNCLDFDDIWGYSIKITYGDEKSILLFKKFSYPKVLKKGIVMSLTDGVYDKVQHDVVSVDNVVHAFSLDENMYILNKGQFEKFFNFSLVYQHYLEESIERLNEMNVIENFNIFVEHCLTSDTLTRRMVKVVTEERIENVQENIDNVPKVIDDFALNVQFDEENKKIKYEDGSSITDIITLIKGACVYGALDDEKYLASNTKSLTR